MGKSRFEYEIRGYQYAPELFRAYKGLPGQEKHKIPLTSEQRRRMGNLCLTKGGQAGVAYLKHIEREQARQCHTYKTYDFFLKGERHRYDYLDEIDAAVRTEHAAAYTPDDQPLEFRKEFAEPVPVMTFEEAFWLLNAI